ncbi:hypothetical protein OE88DRAFT_1810728 [Heliocybe sulcata]|uniref:Stress-response A/B barrel domain-containing protein n=1 Tax=Heliocybe sulcata TaxID=5364 RepID=A0A5C3MT94_9AGAM|nr:hypothetical protein OE88DRAFT_1810728 [Heliocybe sulcata]
MPLIQHIALLKFIPGTPIDVKHQAYRRTVALLKGIPQVKNLKAGPPLYPSESRGYDFALTMEFDSKTSFRIYARHPRHSELAKILIPITEGKIRLISYQIDLPSSKL